MRSLRAIALLVIASIALACDKARPNERPRIAPVQREGNRTIWVDTHGQNAFRRRINLDSFPFFRSPDGRPSLALTFDAAWVEPARGMRILDLLRTRGIRTTFFISGPFVFTNVAAGVAGGLKTANFPMLRRMVEDGHEFGSHTQTHPHNGPGVDWDRENRELRAGFDAAMRTIFGDSVPPNAHLQPFWRSPYGEYDERALRLASRAGFPLHVGWNVDVGDSSERPSCGNGTSATKCVSPASMTLRVLRFARRNDWSLPGIVVLAHLQNPYDWTSGADGLGALVDSMETHGVVIRPISEFFNWKLAPDVAPLVAQQ
jgi:peptidoglycan/xylan/chitin deacetylase (PgdA/CDA1 family)